MKAVIKFECDPSIIEKIFKPEVYSNNRSSFTLEKGKDHIKFHIDAKDPTALKATKNSINKSLKIFNKIKCLK